MCGLNLFDPHPTCARRLNSSLGSIRNTYPTCFLTFNMNTLPFLCYQSSPTYPRCPRPVPVQLGFTLVAFPCLTLTYLSQTARQPSPSQSIILCCLRAVLQLGFTLVAFPCLTLTYLGQTAMILERPESSSAAYWESLPHPIKWPMVSFS